MDRKIQEQLDAQIQKKRVAQVVELSEAPTLTSEIFERDARTEAIVVGEFQGHVCSVGGIFGCAEGNARGIRDTWEAC